MLEIINLVELLRKLASRKYELDRNYFERFIQPIWESFYKVHEDYLKSFRGYREQLVNEGCKIETIIDKVRQDAIFTENLRADIFAMAKNLEASNLDESVKKFLKGVSFYLSYGTSEVYGQNIKVAEEKASKWSNSLSNSIDKKVKIAPLNEIEKLERFTNRFSQRLRIPLIVCLLIRREETKRDTAIMILDDAVRFIQHNYRQVADDYHKLRKEWLT